jgi:hypothetical protein
VKWLCRNEFATGSSVKDLYKQWPDRPSFSMVGNILFWCYSNSQIIQKGKRQKNLQDTSCTLSSVLNVSHIFKIINCIGYLDKFMSPLSLCSMYILQWNLKNYFLCLKHQVTLHHSVIQSEPRVQHCNMYLCPTISIKCTEHLLYVHKMLVPPCKPQ